MLERFRHRAAKHETSKDQEQDSKPKKRLGALALAAGTAAGGIMGYAHHDAEQPRPPALSESAANVIEAYEAVNSVDDLFDTEVAAVKAGKPAQYDDYPGRKVPSLEVDITSQMTELAKQHEKVLPDNAPELEWQHRIAALNTFYTSDGKKVRFEQPSWPIVEDGVQGTATKEEPFLMDRTPDGKFHVTIPLGQAGPREMAIVEKLSVLPNGVAGPTGEGYPLKEFTRVVDTVKLRVGEDGSVEVEPAQDD